jgi:DNA-binding transcriptional ArsR family regulator
MVPQLDELRLLHNSVCRALGEPKRIQMLYALNARPCHVTELAARLEMPQSTVSRHLAVLRQTSLVTTRREGSATVYSVAEPRIIKVLDMMRDILRRQMERQVTTLEGNEA